jgi:hypothetical protein
VEFCGAMWGSLGLVASEVGLAELNNKPFIYNGFSLIDSVFL